MKYLSFVIKNLFRQPVRSLLTIFGVAVATAVLISLIGFNQGYKESLNNDINKMGYEVLVTAKGCPYEAATLMMQGGEVPRYINGATYDKVKDFPEIKEMTKLFLNAVMTEDSGFKLFMGIDDDFIKLKPWMKVKGEGKWFSSPEAEEVILGYEAAELMTRKVGDELYVGGKVNKVFKVVGIFERSGTQDDGTVFLPLKSAQKTFGFQNQITGLGIKLKDIKEYDAFVNKIDVAVPEVQTITFAQVKGTIVQLIQTAQMLIIAVAAIAIFVSIIGVLNTILMSVIERTPEIGILKAMGASSVQIFKVIWLETIVICFFGGILGSIIAFLASKGVENILRKALTFSPSGQLVSISPDLVLYSLIGAIVLGLLAGFYPAFRASKMDPVKAIYS